MGIFLNQVYQHLTFQSFYWLQQGDIDRAIGFLVAYLHFLGYEDVDEYSFTRIKSLSTSKKEELFFKLLNLIHDMLLDKIQELATKNLNFEVEDSEAKSKSREIVI